MSLYLSSLRFIPLQSNHATSRLLLPLSEEQRRLPRYNPWWLRWNDPCERCWETFSIHQTGSSCRCNPPVSQSTDWSRLPTSQGSWAKLESTRFRLTITRRGVSLMSLTPFPVVLTMNHNPFTILCKWTLLLPPLRPVLFSVSEQQWFFKI